MTVYDNKMVIVMMIMMIVMIMIIMTIIKNNNDLRLRYQVKVLTTAFQNNN